MMDAERYMRRDVIWLVISTWENIEDLIFMQDGASPDFAIIRKYLNAHLPGDGWIVVVHMSDQSAVLTWQLGIFFLGVC